MLNELVKIVDAVRAEALHDFIDGWDGFFYGSCRFRHKSSLAVTHGDSGRIVASAGSNLDLRVRTRRRVRGETV